MKFIKHACGLLLLSLLPSCSKLVDWGKDTFPQGEQLDVDLTPAQSYIQSVTVYDQFTTRAKFDALWLSDEVRTIYSDLYSSKYGRTEEQRKSFLRRQLEENKHFISFYILSLYEMPLGDQNSQWSVFLRIDEKNYAPMEIKSIDLSTEYVLIFGKRFNRFKVAYQCKFDAKDIDDQLLISTQISNIALYFRSVKKETTLVWHFNQHDRVIA